jgi:class 3 adenylate cyclase/tetratricopeptide (TPR) repeat protein
VRCHGCHTENRAGRRFCAACGEALATVCPSCAFVNAPDERFCGGCGRAQPAPVGPSPAPREGYTPRHLVERVLASRHALEGERKQVTVLFCDVVDSTRLAEDLDPERMHQVIGRLLALMADAVHRHEGTVNQYLGDGIMALFGAPVALEDHAVRAVLAALTIQDSVAGYAKDLAQLHGVEVRLRMGLNTGPVVVGRIGDDLRMDYTAVGDTTHLAARLQESAAPGAIVTGETTHRLVEGHVLTEPLGTVAVRGRRQPVTAFQVLGRRRRRSHFAVRAERGLTPLVGRERELSVLHDAWQRARDGHGQTVGVSGEPGVGKSRLVFEFRRALSSERRTWLEAHCSSIGQSRPYLPVLEMLRAILHIEDDDAPAVIEDKLRAGVGSADVALDKHLPLLRELFDLPGDDQGVRHLDPQMKRRLTFEALRACTVGATVSAPLVLLYEDLHWIDRTSEDYLDDFVQAIAAWPVLLVTTCRPGYTVRWAHRAWYTEVPLDVLSEPQAHAIVTTLLGTDKVPGDLLARIWEKSEGNPLALEEITGSLRERRVIVVDGGGIRWAADAQVEFPLTIQDVVRARIDALDEPVKDTVEMASAIGREFDVRLLGRVRGAPVEVERHLATLKELALVHETRTFPGIAFAFKHAVIQDVAYQSLLQHRKSELHAAIAQAVEELGADEADTDAAVLAHHYGLTPRHDKAFRYAMTAGDRAARVLARTEARTYYEQALTAARSLPVSPDARRSEIDAVLKLASVGMTREEIQRDQGNLAAALGMAQALRDEPRTARVLYWIGRIHYLTGNAGEAIVHAEQSLAIADALGDDALAAPPVNLMGRAYYSQSDYRQACRMMARSVEQMRRLGNRSEEATAEAWVGGLLALMGEFDQGLPHLDHGIQLARTIENPSAEAAGYYYRGIIHEQRGAPERALADYEQSRALAERTGDAFRIYVVKIFESQAYAIAGDPARGRALLDEAEALAARLGTKFYVALRTTYLAACLLAQGQHDGVPDVCRQAIQLAHDTGDVYAEALAHRILADALLQVDPPDWRAAAPAVDHAIAVQERIGARPELARSYRTSARVLRAKGDDAAAQAQLARAFQMFREMRMAWDLTHADDELRAG